MLIKNKELKEDSVGTSMDVDRKALIHPELIVGCIWSITIIIITRAKKRVWIEYYYGNNNKEGL